jgi:hypothetical protein
MNTIDGTISPEHESSQTKMSQYQHTNLTTKQKLKEMNETMTKKNSLNKKYDIEMVHMKMCTVQKKQQKKLEEPPHYIVLDNNLYKTIDKSPCLNVVKVGGSGWYKKKG